MTSFGDEVLHLRVPCSRKKGGIVLSGRSMAGHWTCIACVELGICFDIGAPSHAACGCRVLCISHGHTDHINSLATHARVRKMKSSQKPLYLAPSVCVQPIIMMFRASHMLDCGWDGKKAVGEEEEGKGKEKEECGECEGKPKHTFFADDDAEPIIRHKKKPKKLPKSESYKVPITDPEPETKYFRLQAAEHEVEVGVGGGLTVVPLATTHTVPSLGYVVIEKRKKLKEQYLGLPSVEIRELIQRGEKINSMLTIPLLAFTGDTTIEGVLSNPLFLQTEILIMECTALDSGLPRDRCRDRGHIHLEDLNENAERFEEVRMVVLTHFSCRYHRNEIKEKVMRSRFAKVNEGRVLCYV